MTIFCMNLLKTHRSVLVCNTGHLITIHTGGK